MLAVLASAGCSAALGPEAETEEGVFFSGDIRLSYALDIPVAGATPYPIVAFVIIRSGPTVTVGQHNYWDDLVPWLDKALKTA